MAGKSVAKDVIHRGDVVLAPALHAPTERFAARLHSHASERGARIVPLGDPIAPGHSSPVRIVLRDGRQAGPSAAGISWTCASGARQTD